MMDAEEGADRVFQWSPAEVNLRELLEEHEDRLPVIAAVTQGYMGTDEFMYDFAKGEVYLVYAVKKQTRVLMTDELDRTISIPINYRLKFQTIDKNDTVDKEAMTLLEIVKNVDKTGIYPRLRLEGDAHVEMYVGSSQEACAKFGELVLEDTYEEKYLVAFTVNEEDADLDGRPSCLDFPLSIPVYMNISLQVAWGMQQHSREGIREVLHRLASFVKKVDLEGVEINQEIMQLPEHIGDGNYQYIMPMQYINIHEPTGLRPPEPRETGQTEGKPVRRKLPPPDVVNKYLNRPPPPVPGQDRRDGLPLPQTPQSQAGAAPKHRPNVPSRPPPPRPASAMVSADSQDESKQNQGGSTSSRPGTGPPPEEIEDYHSYITIVDKPNAPPVPAPRPKKSPASPPVAAVAATEPSSRGMPASRQVPPRYQGKPLTTPTGATFPVVAHVSPVSQTAPPLDASVTSVKVFKPRQSSRTSDYEYIEESLVVDTNPDKLTQSVDGATVIVSPEMQQQSLKTVTKLAAQLSSLDEVPDDCSMLTIDHVGQVLDMLKMNEHIQTLIDHDVDGELLKSLTEEMLVDELHFSKLQAIKLSKFANDGWRPKKN